jgi:hypothetical protein
MKTLKECLKPYAFQEYNSDDETDESHQMYYIGDIIKAVEKWLTQKRQEAVKRQEEYGLDPVIPMVNIDELLGELET